MIAWMRANLFNGIASTITTFVLGFVIARTAWSLLMWLVIKGTWHPADIRNALMVAAPAGRSCKTSGG